MALPLNGLRKAFATTRFQKDVNRQAKETTVEEVSKLWPSKGSCHWNMGTNAPTPCGKRTRSKHPKFKCAVLLRRALAERHQAKVESTFALNQMRGKACYWGLCVIGHRAPSGLVSEPP